MLSQELADFSKSVADLKGEVVKFERELANFRPFRQPLADLDSFCTCNCKRRKSLRVPRLG